MHSTQCRVLRTRPMRHQTIETKYWTTRVVVAFFGKCAQTLIPWRRGGMPHTIIHGNQHPIFLYEPQKLRDWAKEHGVQTHPKRAKAVLAEALEAA